VETRAPPLARAILLWLCKDKFFASAKIRIWRRAAFSYGVISGFPTISGREQIEKTAVSRFVADSFRLWPAKPLGGLSRLSAKWSWLIFPEYSDIWILNL
jgi:hypothetical protein